MKQRKPRTKVIIDGQIVAMSISTNMHDTITSIVRSEIYRTLLNDGFVMTITIMDNYSVDIDFYKTKGKVRIKSSDGLINKTVESSKMVEFLNGSSMRMYTENRVGVLHDKVDIYDLRFSYDESLPVDIRSWINQNNDRYELMCYQLKQDNGYLTCKMIKDQIVKIATS